MNSLRILVLGPGSNPDSVTGALIGFSHAEALARLHTVTLVIRARDEDAVRRAKAPFLAIEAVSLPWLDRLWAWAMKRIFKNDYGSLTKTASLYPMMVAFEWRAWRRLRSRIRSGEFDVVLRLLPIVPMLPSPFAFFLRKGPIPFVIGPLNGGLPWPKGFSQIENQRHAPGHWVADLRNLYRYLPFAHSTYSKAAAIIAGSLQTCIEFAHYRDKVFFVPGENGMKGSFLDEVQRSEPRSAGVLELIYVGRLVPYKACDIALRGAASLLREGSAHFSVVGDGQDRQRLQHLVQSLGIENSVTFCGMLSHAEALRRLQKADVLVFPSLREFGGGVVFEALGLGAIPVVADFGGPGDIVIDQVGYKIPLVNEDQMASEIESVLKHLASDRSHVETLSREGMSYARNHLTWDAKARMVTEILHWVTGRGAKPNLPPPKPLASSR